MSTLFAETLRKQRKEQGLSQIQLANQMFVNKSTIARWENGSRLPDAAMIARLSRILKVDIATLFSTVSESDRGRQQSHHRRQFVCSGGSRAERHGHRL